MTETPHLDKLVRLATAQVRSYQRTSPSGKVQTVHQYQQGRQGGQGQPAAGAKAAGGGTLGKGYTTSWGNVNVGDVVEFAPGDLWRVIPASKYPGYKPPTTSGKSTGSGPGATSGTTVGAGTAGAQTTSGTSTSKSSSTGTGNTTNTYSNYLQNYYNPARYAILTLPASQIVTVIPVIP